MSNLGNLTSKVMLASISISVWGARRFDGKVTSEIEEAHRAKGIGRFNKRLLPDHCPSYKKVQAIANRFRAHFYNNTLEYEQRGSRLLPTRVYMALADRARGYKNEFDRAVSIFMTDYQNLKDQARIELNGLFNEDDYPSAAQLNTKFAMKMSVLPFPDASQFGIDVPPDVLAEIRHDIDEHVRRSVELANRDLIGRLYEAVKNMAERLGSANTVRIDVATQVKEMCALLPQLNFTDDPMLTHVLDQARKHLAVHSGVDLKESPVLRSQVAEKATEIEHLMASFMGGGPRIAFGADGGELPTQAHRCVR
ncbi:DUF3150 domain-containing protein (plasmid) [Pararobbsia alpina]